MENFFEGDVSGDTIILYSRIEKLFFKNFKRQFKKMCMSYLITTKKINSK